jgi:formylglycine-generating enzyme required for sulfatase activity
MRALVVLVATFVGCASFDSPPEGANPDGGAPDASAPEAGGGASCPGVHGPAGVRVGAFCIDSTEVTREQYREFVDAMDASLGDQPQACVTNTSFVPRIEWPYAPGEATYPVRGVDWCDAFAFCKWAGKRLCGRIGGGPVPPSEAKDHTADQWYAACSANGTKSLPYGNTYDPAACNGAELVPARVRRAGELATCEGGFPGLFDMSGNAFEWEDSCNGPDGTSGCYVRGGDLTQKAEILGCGSAITQPRLGMGNWGFRCCAE